MFEVDLWCIHAWGKQTHDMDTALRKRNWSYMRYWYFADFQHCISVFADFSYGIAVLGTPQCTPQYLILFNPLIQLEAEECPLKTWSFFMQ